MAASPATASAQPRPALHVHFDDQCPVCDQEIPADRLEEVHGRYAVRLREQTAEATAELREQHTKERAEAEAKAKADREAALQRLREENAARERAIREEEERKRDELLKERLAQAEATRKEQEEALIQRAAAAEQRAKAAAETSDGLKVDLEQIKHANAEALEAEKKAAAGREAAARAAGKLEAETASQTAIGDLKAKLAAADEAKNSVVADLNGKIAAEAAAKQAAQQEAAALKQGQEEAIALRVQEARDALEKDKSEALLAKEQTHFAERQRLQAIVDDLKRKLENQKSGELGDGAEIKLYDVLKEAFPDDRIRRVEKGAAGADIIHEVMLNGKVAGLIVYDSKNRGAWQSAFATKLRQDQITAGADHAVLSTNKFPKEGKELYRTEGVILVSPARAVVLAELLRGHIVGMHDLRVSNDERDAKTEQLYAFITSSQCREMMQSIEDLVDKLLKLETDELKAHQKVWTTRGGLLKSVLKSNANFRFALANILGGDGQVGEGAGQ